MAAMSAFRDLQTTNFEHDDPNFAEKYYLNDLSYDVTYRQYENRQTVTAARKAVVIDDKGASRNYITSGVKITSALCENVLVHPFLVLRRQCQVIPKSHRYHLIPITLVPIIVKLQGRQGLGTLWKGIGSVLILKGLAMICEDALSKLTHWPKELHNFNSAKKIGQHIILKLLSAAIITPFYSACLIETVQSDIASEKPGVFDCITEGIGRLIPRKHPSTSRILPVWTLAVPTAIHGVCSYVIASVTQSLMLSIWKYRILIRENRQGTRDSDTDANINNIYMELMSAFVGHLTADVLLYPLETVLNRLHIQGARTIIDNLDSGCEVVPVLTRYEGAADCFHTIVAEEGSAGLFKGFGALLMQYALHAALIKLTRVIVVKWNNRKT